jgi:uncharacterized protein YqfB (UPF0267 family)
MTNTRSIPMLGAMTSDRAQAYGRVMKTIRDLGESKLHADEQQMVREAADALFFCEDLAAEPATREALRSFHGLVDRLVESDRTTPETAARLTADVEGCGPLAPVG